MFNKNITVEGPTYLNWDNFLLDDGDICYWLEGMHHI